MDQLNYHSSSGVFGRSDQERLKGVGGGDRRLQQPQDRKMFPEQQGQWRTFTASTLDRSVYHENPTGLSFVQSLTAPLLSNISRQLCNDTLRDNRTVSRSETPTSALVLADSTAAAPHRRSQPLFLQEACTSLFCGLPVNDHLSSRNRESDYWVSLLLVGLSSFVVTSRPSRPMSAR
jgi:hypothetical protein